MVNLPFSSVLVKQGEAVLITHVNGREEEIRGPRRVRLGIFDSWDSMERVVLDETRQIIVTKQDGSREIIAGPQEYFLLHEPRMHFEEMSRIVLEQNQRCHVVDEDGKETMHEGEKTVFVRPSETHKVVNKTILQEGTAVVVVDEDGKRTVKQGPESFFLGPREKLYTFTWTGGEKKEPRYLRFDTLRTTPDQMYHDVEVRTRDQVILTIKLMIYWQVVDVEKMIKRCDDLIGAMVNIVSSSVASCFGQVTFEEAATDPERRIQGIDTFKSQEKWAEYGVRVEQVRLRGWRCADAQIQMILDQKIQNRTKIESDEEIAKAQHAVAMLKIGQERTELREKETLKELRMAQAATVAEEAGTRRGQEIQTIFASLQEVTGGDIEKALALLDQELVRQTIEKVRGPVILSGQSMGFNLNLQG